MDTERGQAGTDDPWRKLELWFWPIVLYGVSLLTATADYLRDIRGGIDATLAYPVSREIISATVVLLLVWLVVRINARWPLRRIGMFRYVVLHALLSWPFAFLHVVSAASLISFYYVVFDGAAINWSFIVSRVPLEYPKDAIVYLMVLGIINLYGWARFAVGPRDTVDILDDGLTVQTRSGFRFLKLGDIEWIEAARNYVILHALGQQFFLRTTMKEIEDHLSSPPFRRVHRSAIINLDKLDAVIRISSRDHAALLSSGAKVRLGRQDAASLLKRARTTILKREYDQ